MTLTVAFLPTARPAVMLLAAVTMVTFPVARSCSNAPLPIMAVTLLATVTLTVAFLPTARPAVTLLAAVTMVTFPVAAAPTVKVLVTGVAVVMVVVAGVLLRTVTLTVTLISIAVTMTSVTTTICRAALLNPSQCHLALLVALSLR